MGIIGIVFGIIALTIVGTGAFIHFYPDTAKQIATGTILKILDIELKNIDELKPLIPEQLRDLLDKNPIKENDFTEDLPFDESIPKAQVQEILGRPNKLVEFFCTGNEQCITYFKNNEAICERTSGICYAWMYHE